MQVIILCGGKGTRLHEETEFRPKPLVEIGGMPILAHIMNRYGKFGYKDFVLALGYKGHMIRRYFLEAELNANDFLLDLSSGESIDLKRRLKLDYRVSFIDTGVESDTAERVLRAAHYVVDDTFMVSYGDDVCDVDIEKLFAFHRRKVRKHRIYATVTGVHPTSPFGQVVTDAKSLVKEFSEKPMMREYINGGYMVFERKALDSLKKGETLEDGLARLAKKKRLAMYPHEGFWHQMNTMKDVQQLNVLWKRGRPWTK